MTRNLRAAPAPRRRGPALSTRPVDGGSLHGWLRFCADIGEAEPRDHIRSAVAAGYGHQAGQLSRDIKRATVPVLCYH
jgi:hypothetical protein